jgi:hypothetical protein
LRPTLQLPADSGSWNFPLSLSLSLSLTHTHTELLILGYYRCPATGGDLLVIRRRSAPLPVLCNAAPATEAWQSFIIPLGTTIRYKYKPSFIHQSPALLYFAHQIGLNFR